MRRFRCGRQTIPARYILRIYTARRYATLRRKQELIWAPGLKAPLPLKSEKSAMRKIAIVIDTREQQPLEFCSFPDMRTVRAKLWPGDYSLQAYSRMFAIERKSVSDLIGTMMTGYAGLMATTPKRFDCELLGMGGILHLGGRAFVLVEPDLFWDGSAEEQIRCAHYHADIPPDEISRFIETIRHGWMIPVILARSRVHAAEIVAHAMRAANAEKLSWRPFDKWLDDLRPKEAQ